MEQNIQPDLLDPQRSISPSTASESSEDQGAEIQSEPLELLQQRSQMASSTSISVPSKESRNTSQKSQQKKRRHSTARTEHQPITALFPFGGESTLRGTPWEEALYGKRPGKPVQRTVKETEIVAFWTQFFG